MTDRPPPGRRQRPRPIQPPNASHCRKPPAPCGCKEIARIDNTVSLLILQHPQEQDRELGTARLTALHFQDALLKIGLSWPSLTRILGRPTDPQRWAILYLGSAKAAALAPDRDIVVVNKNGNAVEHQECGAARDRRHHPARRHLEPGQGAVVAQRLDAQVQARRARTKAPVALRQAAARAAQRRALDHRGGGHAAGAARTQAGDRARSNASFERLLARYRQTRPISGARRRR